MSFLSGNGASGWSGVSVTVPASSGANKRIGILVANFECTTAPSSVACVLGGVTLNVGPQVVSSAGLEGVAAFWASESQLATIGSGVKSATVTATGGTGIQGVQLTWAFFDGRSQSTPTFNTNSGTAPPGSVTVAVAGANADAFGGACLNNAGTTSPGTGYTAVYNAVDSGSDAQAIALYKAGVGPSSVSPNFTNTGAPQWALVGAVMEAAAAGGGNSNQPLALTGVASLSALAWIINRRNLLKASRS